MLRAAVAAMAIAALTSTGLAQSSGNALCEDYLKKLEACLPKMPQAERDIYKETLDGHKKRLADIPEVRKLTEGVCIQQGNLWKRDLSLFYGCKF